MWNGDIKDYPSKTFVRKGFEGFSLYDLKWDITNELASTSLKKARYFTFVAYSLNGTTKSREGTNYIKLQDVNTDTPKLAFSTLNEACSWISETCIEFWELVMNYVYGVYRIPAGDRKDVKIVVNSGLPELIEAKDDENFINQKTFFPGQFTKFGNISFKKQKVGSELQNSFFMVDLSIKRFNFRYSAPDNTIIVTCFVNIPKLTYMGVALPGVQPTEVINWEESSKTNAEKIAGSLNELVAKKKRKLETEKKEK